MKRQLSLVQFIVITALQTLAMVGGAAWYLRGQAAAVENNSAAIVRHDSELKQVTLVMQRIDTEGSRRWTQMQPTADSAVAEIKSRLAKMEDSIGQLNIGVARLTTLTEQNQRLIKSGQ